MKTVSIEVTRKELNILLLATQEYVSTIEREIYKVAVANKSKDNTKAKESLLKLYESREQTALGLSAKVNDLWHKYNEQMD